jgi:very-short-patch-repair endonuclease
MTIEISKDYLLREYREKERSTYDIATEFNTYPNRILRLLKKFGIPRRDKSKAQAIAIETGRHTHPTRGKKRSESTRIKIAEGVSKAWEQLSDDERNRRVSIAQQQWENMSDEDREELRRLAANGMRKAAEEGSQLEKFILAELRRRQYNVIFHKSNIVANEQLQVDLYLPDLSTVIEIDGPSHFLPIWGELKLARHLASDHAKTGLLLNAGYIVIRVKNIIKNISNIQFRKVLTILLEKLELIKKRKPAKSERLIEIELSQEAKCQKSLN